MVHMISGIISTEETRLFLRSIQSTPVTGTETAAQGFSESTSGVTYMLTTAKFAYTCAVKGVTVDAVITKSRIVS